MDLALDAGVDAIEHVPTPQLSEADWKVAAEYRDHLKLPADYEAKLVRMIKQHVVMVPTLSVTPVICNMNWYGMPVEYQPLCTELFLAVVRRFHDLGGMVALGNDYGYAGLGMDQLYYEEEDVELESQGVLILRDEPTIETAATLVVHGGEREESAPPTPTRIGCGLPARRIGPLGRLMFDLGQIPPTEAAVIDNNAPRPVAPEPGITVAHGEYLVRSTCSACHGDSLNGGSVRGLDGELEIELNLSPGGELANWSEAEFMTALRSGVTPSGRVISETMP